MNKKRKPGDGAFVYSTDPSFNFETGDNTPVETPPPPAQQLRVSLDKKQRGGKMVTLVTGFKGKEDDLETLGKTLKSFCGTGGAVKDNEIMVQGDQREKVLAYLLKQGYSKTKKSG
jgi:translation initiation factor 1